MDLNDKTMALLREYTGNQIDRGQAIAIIDNLKKSALRAKHSSLPDYVGSYEMYEHEQALLSSNETDDLIIQSLLDKAQALYIPLSNGRMVAPSRNYRCSKWIASTGISELEAQAVLHQNQQLSRLYKDEKTRLLGKDLLLSSSILDKHIRLYAPLIAQQYGG